jgi:hypothetical protein
MHIDVFKRIGRQVADLEKTGVKFDVCIKGDAEYNAGANTAYFEPINFKVTTLKQLAEVQTVLARPLRITYENCKITLPTGKQMNCVKTVPMVLAEMSTKPELKSAYPSLKFYSNLAYNRSYHFTIDMIASPPLEQTEEEVTYRYIGDNNSCMFCIPHTHELYNYLDQGSFFCKVTRNSKEKIIITSEMTVDTYLCFYMAYLQPDLIKHFQNECYVNPALAKVLRIKMEKEYVPPNTYYHRQGDYGYVKDAVFKEYEKTVSAGLFEKLSKGQIPSGSFNNIKLTKTSADYEGINIVAPDLLAQLMSVMVFDDRTDIYGLIRTYIQTKLAKLENMEFTAPATPAEGEAATEKEEQVFTTEFNINGIDIKVKRTNLNTRRYVNDVAINKEEVDPVCYRASCFDNQEIFDRFLTSVRAMSLKWHDAIANGVGVKIHDTMSHEEYSRPEAPLAAPKLKFRKKEDEVHLVIDGEKSVPIKFTTFLAKVATLNRKTTNSYQYDGYLARNAAWCRRELIALLKECCTFEEKTLVTELKDKKQVPVLVDGKKQYTKKQVCKLSDKDAEFIEKMAREYHTKALEKSKLFLEKAVKDTGAKLERWNGEDHYIVEGKMRKYAVKVTTNQVFNYDTKQYICIVEPGHQVSVGGDATACRLYALKNDQANVAKIGTLRHG